MPTTTSRIEELLNEIRQQAVVANHTGILGSVTELERALKAESDTDALYGIERERKGYERIERTSNC